MENKTEKKWYQKPTAVVLLLIFFFPVGLYLMWKHEVWSKTARWIISAVFALAVISNAGKDDSTTSNISSNCSEISGTYSGTSKMGSTSGTAKIVISSDCGATLSYDQGSMGGATEYGEITGSGTNYKFDKSDGGSYDLTITNSKVVLDGYNWQCVMTK
jgi:hypothetical protein